MEGLHLADSITLNPQKLLGITKTSSMLLLRDRSKLRDAFSTGLPYMESPCSDGHGGEVGLQGTRPAEVLKLWLGLRQLGIEGIGAVLESALERKAMLNGCWPMIGYWCWMAAFICWPCGLGRRIPLGPPVGPSRPASCSCARDFSSPAPATTAIIG